MPSLSESCIATVWHTHPINTIANSVWRYVNFKCWYTICDYFDAILTESASDCVRNFCDDYFN